MYGADADATLLVFSRLIEAGICASDTGRPVGPLKTGVDLGTANIVLSVVDADNTPVTGATCPSTVVRDGIVVDYVGAVATVRRLKAELEERLGCELRCAGTAIPPGILAGNVKAIANVVEAAGFDVVDVSDEPTAAARVLGVRDGAVVDVGGGTTGISILRDGEVVFTDDEATGGTHMTLVLAGAHGISFEQAEVMKTDPAQSRDVFAVVRPVVEKMASIVNRCLKGYDVDTIYVVGGACSFDQFEEVFRKQTGRSVVKPAQPLLVTPLGIAMYGDVPAGAGR
ncbi:ethanolamine utilization protein EutJ [Telmatospirillum sp.]|uniref:ethanolamine utilization protein EutJ n=1 Tax=Telmatospirillum sp. TaxID=2079197 RepID=UPI00284FF539|nr:ethanolamine utilization protein EutJ [Telmatospirillum sp.]MDR3438611.1 ethanolamine utilization protein EutJ [Telmatospirillum sp.]